MRVLAIAAMLGLGSTLALVSPASAERVDNGVAVFAALDKVTARISKLEVPLNETVRFGALKVTPRACYTRPPTEQPKSNSFVEVDEVQLDGKEKRIFSGWMSAESPELNAVEHPVFDVWLTECQKPAGGAVPQPAAAVTKPAAGVSGAAAAAAAPPAGDAADAPLEPRRRVRR